MCELAMNAPVAPIVGIGQIAGRDAPANAQMVELRRLGSQTDLDVAQALPVGQLGEGHVQELVEATEAAHVEVALVLRHRPAGEPCAEA